MTEIRNVTNIVKDLAETTWGKVVLILAGILLLGAVGEILLLSGEKVYSDYLAYSKPLTFEATSHGERFRIVIQSRSKKAKKRIKHIITGPDGKTVVEDRDGYRKRSRAFYFNAKTPGKYTLKIDDYYSPGGYDLPSEAARYVNAKWVDIFKGDKTRLLGTMENFIVLW